MLHLISLNEKKTRLVGLPWTRDRPSHTPIPHNAQNSRQTDMLPTGLKPAIPSKQVASDTRLRLARSPSVHCGKQTGLSFVLIPCTVHLLLFCTMTNKCTQLFHKLSHSYMFRHYRVILRQLVINTLPSYTSISNADVGNTV